ncbi:DUF3817 domain-containing protein [Botryobacter ruber]|uniref:DUF3817 domain-containing protein n=1 Tax=Botryobacter ruber TaxID=2171629 RepID=UPI000E0ABF0F|nr:DUF3817 domain-containing protein [Botryobacter ruber]
MITTFSNTVIGRLRFIGILEGISSLILFGIAMPLKYLADMPEAVKYVGWAHGVLFLLYIAALLQATLLYRWSFLKLAAGVVASLLPFGPFVFDARLLKREEEAQQKKKLVKQKV